MKNGVDTRKCIVSGEAMEKEGLLRFTVVDNLLVPDFAKRLPGKGIYVCNSLSALNKAIEKKIFSKVARKQLSESYELVEMVTNILKKKGLDSINLARKSGILVTGFEKVKELVIKKKAAFLLEAIDAGQDGKKKLNSLAKELEIMSLYTIEELDKALDKVNTVNVAFKNSSMAQAVYKDLFKLKEFLEN